MAWREGERVHCSPSRRDAVALDALPWPDRADTAYDQQDLPTASMLASRGCPWNCSFCSIVTFYEGNGTRGRRRREPVCVADELEHLVRDRGVRLILFQDDDFLTGGSDARAWALAVAQEIVRRGLHERTRFKFSCRSDEVREDVLAPLDPMERQMRAEGRLVGPALEADYHFLDRRLDVLWDFSLVAFAGRNYGKDATWDRLRSLVVEARLDYPDRPRDPAFRTAVRTLVASSNRLLLDVAEDALGRIERAEVRETSDAALVTLARMAREENERMCGVLDALWHARPHAPATALSCGARS